MAELLRELALGRAGEPGVTDARRSLSWGQLNVRVNRWVSLLRTQGLSTGDTIGVVMGNRSEVFEILLAGLHAGLTVVPVNCHLAAPEVSYLLRDSGSRAVVVDEERAALVAQALATTGAGLRSRLVTGPVDRDGFSAVEPLLAVADGTEPAQQCCGSILLYTSGTSGVPKGVVNGVFQPGAALSQVDRLLAYAGLVLGVPAGRSALLVGPWYHSAQLYFALLPLLRGCRLLVASRFDAAQTLQAIDRDAIAVCHLVPTQFVRLLRLPAAVRHSFAGDSLRRVWHGGGPCPVGVKRQMIDWWGPIIVEYYAATEGGIVTLIEADEWLAKPGSVGRAIAPTRVHIVAPDGTQRAPGQVGRVFFQRTRAQDFHYRGDPDKTRAAHLAPGIYTYGELGYLDDDGYLFLTGRDQHTIVSGGVNIYPAEVEAALLAHEAVQDVAVLGVPDAEYGERVLAVVQLVGGGLPPDEAPAVLERHCRTQLAGFKVPRAWRLVDRLPRDEAGKLRRDTLRDAYLVAAGDPP